MPISGILFEVFLMVWEYVQIILKMFVKKKEIYCRLSKYYLGDKTRVGVPNEE